VWVISAVVRPQIRRNVRAMRASTVSTGWHGEDEPQNLIIDHLIQ
jgi:hypothetical protein